MDFDNSNGLIGLNRNVVLRLIKFLDAEKTRNIVGMGNEIYYWTKLSLWNWTVSALDLPLTFLPNSEASSTVKIVGSLFINLGELIENCFFLHEEMKRGVYKAVFISNGDRNYERCTGLVHKSRFDYFYTFTILSSGSCFVCNTGIICGDSWVLKKDLFSQESEQHTTTLELDMDLHQRRCRTHIRAEDRDRDKSEEDNKAIKHDGQEQNKYNGDEGSGENRGKRKEEEGGILHALIDGKQMPYAITGVPQSVHFALDVWCFGSIQVLSYQRLKMPSIGYNQEIPCTTYFKWK